MIASTLIKFIKFIEFIEFIEFLEFNVFEEFFKFDPRSNFHTLRIVRKLAIKNSSAISGLSRDQHKDSVKYSNLDPYECG